MSKQLINKAAEELSDEYGEQFESLEIPADGHYQQALTFSDRFKADRPRLWSDTLKFAGRSTVLSSGFWSKLIKPCKPLGFPVDLVEKNSSTTGRYVKYRNSKAVANKDLFPFPQKKDILSATKDDD